MRILTRRDTGLLTQWTFGSSAIDTDALAFISAASITDLTQQSAIINLVTSLKSNNLWNKFDAIYPFVGGTANSHKYNLIDPRDLDAAFRLNFVGGWTHSSTGALPNGVNAYADTRLSPSSSLNINNTHLSYYSRSNIAITSNRIFFDTFISASNCMQFYFDSALNQVVFDAFNTSDARVSSAFTRTDGFYIGSTTSISNRKIYRNNTILNTNTTTNTLSNLPNIPLFLAAANTTGGAVVFSNLQCAFGSIGDGLNDTEAANFNTIVTTFQTTLGRQV